MHRPKLPPFQRSMPATDVASTTIKVVPWMAHAEPKASFSGETETTLSEGLRHVVGPKRRMRYRKPGDIHRTGPCDMQAFVDEHLDYRESPCERFVNGVGKSYDGYRLAHTEDDGFVRIENDGSESVPDESDIARFRKDLAKAALADERIAGYITEKGI